MVLNCNILPKFALCGTAPVYFSGLSCNSKNMFIKVTQKSTGKTYVRIMESVRKGDKILQKTVRSLGWCKSEKELNTLKQMAQKILVEPSNDRQPALPGMAEIVYSREPAHCKKKHSTQKRKKKQKTLALFSLTNPREKARVQHGIKGVCGAVYEQLNFHTIIHDTNKDQQWNEILKYCVLSRVAHPDSKRKTVETLKEDYNETVPLEKMYRM